MVILHIPFLQIDRIVLVQILTFKRLSARFFLKHSAETAECMPMQTPLTGDRKEAEEAEAEGGGCKPIWDIGIWVIFSGILGYCFSEIGILGYPCGIWDIGILV